MDDKDDVLDVNLILTLQDALVDRNWSSETELINYVNKQSGMKIKSAKEINMLLKMASNQMSHHYAVRCFLEPSKFQSEKQKKTNSFGGLFYEE